MNMYVHTYVKIECVVPMLFVELFGIKSSLLYYYYRFQAESKDTLPSSQALVLASLGPGFAKKWVWRPQRSS